MVARSEENERVTDADVQIAHFRIFPVRKPVTNPNPVAEEMKDAKFIALVTDFLHEVVETVIFYREEENGSLNN